MLRLLLEGNGAAVVVLARSVATATLPSIWRGALGTGRMAVVSRSASSQRLTEQGAADRNDLAARLADRIAVAHTSPGGRLSQQCVRWRSAGMDVWAMG